MKRASAVASVGVLAIGLSLVPGAQAIPSGSVVCGGAHFVRLSTGSEIVTTSIGLRNLGSGVSVTVSRITVRDFFGNVVHDSGPAIGVPHPLNTDIVPPQDITVVPPGASYYLATNHVWGNNSIPGGNQQGFAIAVTVQFSGHGSKDFLVTGNLRVRERLSTPGGFVQGEEHSRQRVTCVDT